MLQLIVILYVVIIVRVNIFRRVRQRCDERNKGGGRGSGGAAAAAASKRACFLGSLLA